MLWAYASMRKSPTEDSLRKFGARAVDVIEHFAAQVCMYVRTYMYVCMYVHVCMRAVDVIEYFVAQLCMYMYVCTCMYVHI
jgi:hypothetical protein